LQAVVLDALQPFTLLCLRSFAAGDLEPGLDGRFSAGPLDVAAFLATPAIAAAVDALVVKRQERNVTSGLAAGAKSTHLPYVIHVRVISGVLFSQLTLVILRCSAQTHIRSDKPLAT
jgi:hypothetical protein